MVPLWNILYLLGSWFRALCKLRCLKAGPSAEMGNGWVTLNLEPLLHRDERDTASVLTDGWAVVL